MHKMANGTLLISGNFPLQSIRSSVLNLQFRSCNMLKGSTGHHPLSHLDSIVVMNSPQRARPMGKKSSVSRESKELCRSSDDELPVMRLFRKFVTRAGVLVECTHRGCKPVFEEEDSKCQVPNEWPSCENIISDILQKEYTVFGWEVGRGGLAERGIEVKGIERIMEQTREKEVVNVVGMYASFLWATEESRD